MDILISGKRLHSYTFMIHFSAKHHTNMVKTVFNLFES